MGSVRTQHSSLPAKWRREIRLKIICRWKPRAEVFPLLTEQPLHYVQIAYLVSGGVPVVVILPMGQHSLLDLLIPALCSYLEAKTHLSVLQQTTLKAFIFSFSHLGEFSELYFTDDLTYKCCCLTAKDISWNMLTLFSIHKWQVLAFCSPKNPQKHKEDKAEDSFTLHSSAERLWYSGHPDMEKCRSCFPVRCPAKDHKKTTTFNIWSLRGLKSILDGQIPDMSFSRSMLSLLPV